MLHSRNLFFVTLLPLVILLVTNVYSFDPKSVDIKTKQTWCNDQYATCKNICLDSGSEADTNYCTAETLDYRCICKNGVAPNSTEYTQTIPYFQCTYDQEVCTKACGPAAQQCVDGCQKNCTATVNKPPNAPPDTVENTTPASPSSPTETNSGGKKPKNVLDNVAVMIPPIGSSFLLLLTMTIAFLARISLDS